MLRILLVEFHPSFSCHSSNKFGSVHIWLSENFQKSPLLLAKLTNDICSFKNWNKASPNDRIGFNAFF